MSCAGQGQDGAVLRNVDPLATAAEIATLLQVAETVPQLQQRHTSQRERQEAYLEYQRQVYKVMAGINHLSVLAQVKTTSWQATAVAAIPMISPFVDLVLPDEPSKSAFVRSIHEVLRHTASLTKALSPITPPVLATVHQGGNQFRDQVIADLGKMNDSLAGYLTAFAELRRVGRPGPVRASRVVHELLQELLDSIPERDDRVLLERLLSRRQNKKAGDLQTFNGCLNALGKANAQFMSEAQADRLDRLHAWQILRKNQKPVLSAKELLSGDGGAEQE